MATTARLQPKSKTKKESYDPSKNYEWDEKESFTISGKEFGYFQTLASQILSKPETQLALLAVDVATIAQGIIRKGFEEGKVHLIED